MRSTRPPASACSPSWPPGPGAGAFRCSPALVAAALDHRHGVDGRLGRWTRAHVADALAVWFPRTVALLDDDRDAVPVALHALIGFLAERDWLDTASAPPAELHAQIDDSTPALHDALADERNRDLGTFWAVQLRRHGVTAADPAAVARFLEQVRRGEVDVDRDALAEVTRRDTGEPGTGPSAPEPAPVLLPGAAALLASAESAEAVARLRTVARWVRTGRRADRRRPAPARRRPFAGRRPRRRRLLPRPRPHRGRPARDQPARGLGPPGPAAAGRQGPARAGEERRGAAGEADRAVAARLRRDRHSRRALRRQQRVRGAVAVRDVAGRGVADPAVRPLRGRRRSGARSSCSTGGSARPSTSGSAASSTTWRATSSSGCGAATSPRCSTPWSCSAPCT